VWHQARRVAVLEDDGSIREWVGICVDIEDRRRARQQQIEAEKALRDLNETLEQRVEAEARDRARIWNVSQDLLVVADAEGRFLNVNPAWTATLAGPKRIWSAIPGMAASSGRPENPNTPGWLKAAERCGLKPPAAQGRNLRQLSGRQCRRSSTPWRDITGSGRGGPARSRRELARVSRQTTMGAMTSIAHEINQPLGNRMNGNARCGFFRAGPDLEVRAD
jgi:PAS domain-containing protein